MDNRKEIVENILSELNGRSGFDDWWYNIDEDIQAEITETLVNLLPIHVVVGMLPKCEHKNIDRQDGCDECLDCGVRNY